MDNNYQGQENGYSNNYQNGGGQGYPGGYPNGSYPGSGQGNGYPGGPVNVYPSGSYGNGYPGSQGPVVVNQLENKKDSHAVTSLVLGILGIVFFWCLGIPIVICLIGLIMGIISLVKTGQNSGMALAGVITSAIGLVLSFAVVILYILAL